jgi:hypothetical protein
MNAPTTIPDDRWAPMEAYADEAAALQQSETPLAPSSRDDGPPAHGHHAATPKAFQLIRARDMEFSDPEFVVNNLIETSAMALVFGDPGCGKSFLAVDIACAVSIGRAFHGEPVKKGPVIYVLGEGHNGMKRRLMAWERSNECQVGDAPLFFSKVSARFLDEDSAQSVAVAVDAVAATEGPPVLIVIDTLARSFGGGDENNTADMGRFIAALDDLKARYSGCTILIIHHTGHGEKQRARGNMSLKGALDAEYRVEKSDDVVTITNTKMKDATPPSPVCFRLASVDIGTSKAGATITSAALQKTEARAGNAIRRLSPAQRMAMASFEKARRQAGLADDPSAGINIETWRAAFYETSTADSPEAKKTAFLRARKALVESGDLSVSDDVYRLARIQGASQ